MSSQPCDLSSKQPCDLCPGFSLSSVCWGYRDLFQRALADLYEQRLLGAERPRVTEAFFALMRCADRSAYDHVLKEFLSAIHPDTAWILDVPEIFERVTEIGRQFADERLYYGATYFRILGEGGFGRTPSQVRTCLLCLYRLMARDIELALAFLRGYHLLVDRLTPTEIERYLEEGVGIFERNHQAGLRFMEGTVKSSGALIDALTQECRLKDVRPFLVRLLRALVGYPVDVGHLGQLDSDELIERGTHVVCLYRWLYLPATIRHWDRSKQNRDWYLLTTICAAGAIAADSFARIHGHSSHQTCASLVGEETARLNTLLLVEYVRILQWIRARWPGARRLVKWGLEAEYAAAPPVTTADRLFYAASDLSGAMSPTADEVRRLAACSVNVFDTAALLSPKVVSRICTAAPGLDRALMRPLGFMPDFLFRAQTHDPPPEALIADLKKKAEQRRFGEQDRDRPRLRARFLSDDQDDADSQEDSQGSSGLRCYCYDEWSQPEHDYYENYCHVYEKRVSPTHPSVLSTELADLARRVRRVFEVLRPELSKEKHLPDGDEIDMDRLTRYMVLRRAGSCPKVDFYEKTLRNQRDLAVLVLLDVSGSTGQGTDRERTIEIEKQAAVVLGQGLAALGDRFAVCGFSGNGREDCEFFVYKDLDEPWNKKSMSSVLSAYPRSATRIGAALRHAGYRLSLVGAKQRLIILVTDGKPMDTGYDPHTQYAQCDVRMACIENERKCIHTFCISTQENSRADLELMFPGHRFVILACIQRLPNLLPRLYVRLTG